MSLRVVVVAVVTCGGHRILVTVVVALTVVVKVMTVVVKILKFGG